MLKHIAITIMMLSALSISAADRQTQSGSRAVAEAATHTFYMTIEGTTHAASGRLTNVSLSMGGIVTNQMNIPGATVRKALSDRNFPSMIDALNLLAINGWRLCQAYTFEAKGMIVERWIVSKTVEDINQLLEGLVKE